MAMLRAVNANARVVSTTLGGMCEAEAGAVGFQTDPDDWRLRGACVELDPEHFIAGPAEHYPVMMQAREACLWCPVFKECSQSFEGDDHKYALKAGRIPDLQASVGRGRPKLDMLREGRCSREHAISGPEDLDGAGRCVRCMSRSPRTPATHCAQGHEFTEENTIIRTRNGLPYRACRICKRAQERVRKARKRERAKMAA